MSLPGITAPAGTPDFLADGHEVEEFDAYARVGYATGTARTRRVRTAVERVVAVRWLLTAAQMLAVDDWFEVALDAGSREFAARVASQDGAGVLWWRARWLRYETQMLPMGRGIVTGALFLTGSGSATPPDTSAMAMEIVAALTCTPAVPPQVAAMAMEIAVALVPSAYMAMEITVPFVTSRIVGLGQSAETDAALAMTVA